MAAPSIRWLRFPRLSYARGWKLQQHLLDRRLEGLDAGEGLGPSRKRWSNLLLALEHPHVYTLGRRADAAELHFRPGGANPQVDADVFRVDRGGKITYHGPGQLVVYPILDLNMFQRDLHWYVDRIEQVVIDSLARFGIQAHRYPGYPGVWVGERKIAQVGMSVSKWFSMHGFAINVDCELDYFGKMIPCGIKGKGVTSVKQLLHEKERKEKKAGITTAALSPEELAAARKDVNSLHLLKATEVNCDAMLPAVKAAFAEHFGLNNSGALITHETILPSQAQVDKEAEERSRGRPEGILDRSFIDANVDIGDLIEKIKDEPLA